MKRLPDVGRARRWACDDGGERWQVDERLAARLLSLGARGVGGFTPTVSPAAAGPDTAATATDTDTDTDTAAAAAATATAAAAAAAAAADTDTAAAAAAAADTDTAAAAASLTRARATPLSTWLSDRGAIGWREAVARVATLTDACATCETSALFPGPLDLDAVSVLDDRLELRADPLVAALCGATHSAAPSARWMSPEIAAGAPPDGASNRYVLGLVLYRLLTGVHPFSGRGLRLGLADQASRGAPPFDDAIATSLPAGLQSFTLGLLDPDPARRPASAVAIATRLRTFLADTSSDTSSDTSPDASDHGPRASAQAPAQVVDDVNHSIAAVNRRDRDAGVGGLVDGKDGTAVSVRTVDNVNRLVASVNQSKDGPGPRRRRVGGLLALLPIVGGIAIAACVLATVRPTATPWHEQASVSGTLAAQGVNDCATCHPRQAAEWSRSVMAHAARSPLFEALEMLVEEQVGRSNECPDGAGVLRTAGPGACRRSTGLAVTGAGGELWCVNCHAPGENLTGSMPAWSTFDAASRRPLRDLLPASTMEGVGCVFCHEAAGPARPGDAYQGNPSWTSPDTGQVFSSRPEDGEGRFGIANSGYALDARFLSGPLPHRIASASTRSYLSSSEFCGACHDVRLFGSDALRGEPFKRLRNAYSEWVSWATTERAAGRTPASCQDCHMSLYPGVCVATPDGASAATPAAAVAAACPPGTVFEPRAAGSYPAGGTTHYFTGVDVPLARDFDPAAIADASSDADGVPLGARERRDLLLARALRLTLDPPGHQRGELAIPVIVENVGAGHRVPAGFSQEREIWVHLKVTDAAGAVVYEVGRVERGDQDLGDKVFEHVNDTDELGDGRGLFGADVRDGPDAPRWDPDPSLGGREFHGRGLVNFQNGFLRCVTCLGTIDSTGACRPLPGQDEHRADRFGDGDYVPETGECRSNLQGRNAFFETYFPVGALDATRGAVKAPDAIIDTRSLPPDVAERFVYELGVGAARAPFTVEATLEFRAFPPYLVRAFVDYEAEQARRGLRPSGPLIDASALERLDVVDLVTVKETVP